MRPCIVLLVALACSLPLAAQELPLRRTQEIFRFGGANAPEHYAFSAPPRLVVDDAGFIYARVAPDATVLIFDPDGQFVRRVGNRGEGPGEFQVAFGHGFVGDTLWVLNWPTPRISRFMKDGSHISTTRTPYDFRRAFASGAAGLSGLLSGGRAFAIPPSPVIGVDRKISLPMVIGSVDMQQPDTVAMLPNPRGLFVAGVGTWAFDPVPSSPIVAVNSKGSGIAVVSWSDAEAGVMSVRVVAPTGQVRWQRRFQVQTRAILKSVRDSLHAEAATKARPQIEAARRRGASIAGSIETLVEQGLDLPRYYAPARTVVIGIDDSVWIEQMVGLAGGTWYVLDRNGAPTFQVQAPPRFTLNEASLQWLWGTMTDELDVPYMMKLRVVDR